MSKAVVPKRPQPNDICKAKYEQGGCPQATTAQWYLQGEVWARRLSPSDHSPMILISKDAIATLMDEGPNFAMMANPIQGISFFGYSPRSPDQPNNEGHYKCETTMKATTRAPRANVLFWISFFGYSPRSPDQPNNEGHYKSTTRKRFILKKSVKPHYVIACDMGLDEKEKNQT
jgi:hypothetical protein